MAITRENGEWGEVEADIMGINNDGKKLDLE